MTLLYGQWLEFGEKSYTKFNNVRAPSKTQLVDMVLESWKNISEELVGLVWFGLVVRALDSEIQ